jgi:hypothetical protein
VIMWRRSTVVLFGRSNQMFEERLEGLMLCRSMRPGRRGLTERFPRFGFRTEVKEVDISPNVIP